MRKHWEELRIDKGIEVGWGTDELFDLAYRYFYQTFKYVQSITPQTTYVMDIEDLDEPRRTENIIHQLCQKIGLDYHADMVKWKLLLGEECPRLVDGIRRPLSTLSANISIGQFWRLMVWVGEAFEFFQG